MRKKIKQNSGFSLIELIIAIAVLAFLMLAVSSFMGSSVMSSKKAKVDVRMQTQAQETYSLITDSIMQASNILLVGYRADDDSLITFSGYEDDGKETSASLRKIYYVRDEETKNDLTDAMTSMNTKQYYGLTNADVLTEDNVKLFSELSESDKVYVSYLRIESSVPIDMNQVTGASLDSNDQTLTNAITGTDTQVTYTLNGSKKVYSTNDTLVSTFYFEGNNLYYSRKYAFMDKLNDTVDMTSTSSKQSHLYNKYFSYRTGKEGANDVEVSGCVATVNAKDKTIGIDLFYNQSSMTYTTIGRINPRNSFVLVPRK